MVHRLFSLVSTSSPPDATVEYNTDDNDNTTNSSKNTQDTAAAFSRLAPHTGYLWKMGETVRTYKRRFFVLHPATYIYYFLSPTDTQPRGCFDLAQARLLDDDDDDDDGGADTSNNNNNNTNFTLVLGASENSRVLQFQAPTAKAAATWKRQLREQRLDYWTRACERERLAVAAANRRITALEETVQHYTRVDQECQTLRDEVQEWQRQCRGLEAAARQLTRQVRHAMAVVPAGSANEDDDKDNAHEGEGEMEGNSAIDLVSWDDLLVPKNDMADNIADHTADNDTITTSCPSRTTSHTTGSTAFASLVQACEQLMDRHRLAVLETMAALQDVTTAHVGVRHVETRLQRAERDLCRQWEENCGLRKTLKQKKRDKRVLVREVKNLQQQQQQQSVAAASAAIIRQPETAHREVTESRGPDNHKNSSCYNDDDEDKLLNELEEHVLSSIRLHEEFLSVKPSLATSQAAMAAPTTALNGGTAPVDPAVAAALVKGNHAGLSRVRPRPLSRPGPDGSTSTATPTALVALFDDDEDDSQDDDETSLEGLPDDSNGGSGDEDGDEYVNGGTRPWSGHDLQKEMNRRNRSPDISPDRPNPIQRLDDYDSDDNAPPLYSASSQSDSSKSVVTSNGQATSKLVCPLVDVIHTTSSRGREKCHPHEQRDPHCGTINELQVYHLTFYSRKIGLQFQKVPPPQVKSKGLLTEAMTADLAVVPGKTAAELSRIASFSSRAKSNTAASRGDETCEVATPLDAVLVCGFHGFDDSDATTSCGGSNTNTRTAVRRPKLGARLVAFDGVSVEIGKWTFDGIRKAIQARSRPLTLSFRDDFLTTEQRQILTRAAAQDIQPLVNQSTVTPLLPPQRSIQYHGPIIQRRPSFDPSVHSALSAETDHIPSDFNGTQYTHHHHHHPEDDHSAADSDYRHNHYAIMPQSFSASRSVGASVVGGGAGSTSSNNVYSFSETGSLSSASVLAAVGPLVSNLLRRGRNEPFTPEYLRRRPESVENTPQHQDFQSELL
jgi:hypothetical protein